MYANAWWMLEHKIYGILHKNNALNIQTLLGEVGRKTRMQEFVGEEWLCGKSEVVPLTITECPETCL